MTNTANVINWGQMAIYFLIMVAIMAFFIMLMVRSTTRSQKKDEYLWEHYKNQIEQAKVYMRVDRTLDDLFTPRNDNKTFHFVVKYTGHEGRHEVNLKPGDPDMYLIVSKLVDCPQVKDAHVTKTRILAVNNQKIDVIEHRASISKALVGWMLAGSVGAALGAISGKSYVRTVNGENQYTFLVMYDDRSPETENVGENGRRFKFLISKLEG